MSFELSPFFAKHGSVLGFCWHQTEADWREWRAYHLTPPHTIHHTAALMHWCTYLWCVWFYIMEFKRAWHTNHMFSGSTWSWQRVSKIIDKYKNKDTHKDKYKDKARKNSSKKVYIFKGFTYSVGHDIQIIWITLDKDNDKKYGKSYSECLSTSNKCL